MTQDIDSFYLAQEEPNKSCFLALRTMILAQDPKITETQKYGMPCFCYQKKMFCYLCKDKSTNEPYILIVEGRHLDHPRLEAGNRARMKIFRVSQHKDLPVRTIRKIIQQGLDLYRIGKINLK